MPAPTPSAAPTDGHRPTGDRTDQYVVWALALAGLLGLGCATGVHLTREHR